MAIEPDKPRRMVVCSYEPLPAINKALRELARRQGGIVDAVAKGSSLLDPGQVYVFDIETLERTALGPLTFRED